MIYLCLLLKRAPIRDNPHKA